MRSHTEDAMATHERYMRRCLDLARLGTQSTAPNPMVGAALVYRDRIIGEGYHAQYGGVHAEVAAVASVSPEDRKHITQSTMYISLEPCCHHGKTPPCTDLIIAQGIPRVVIARQDPNPRVSGKGISQLQEHGVEVTTGVLQPESAHLLRSFTKYISTATPYVVLKFVQSQDGFIGVDDRQIWLSNIYEKTLVHKMRSEIDAILVGTNTAVIDNPRLTTRLYNGSSPLRVIPDRTLRIPGTHHIFDGSTPTVIYTESAETRSAPNTEYVRMSFREGILQCMLSDLGTRQVMTLMVEGGAGLINAFKEEGLWDEAWVVTVHKKLHGGVRAPILHGERIQNVKIHHNALTILRRSPDRGFGESGCC